MTINVTKEPINLREKLNELDFDKVPFQKMPAGSVLQVVSAFTGIGANTTSGTFVASGTKLSITPSSTASKILGFFHISQLNNGGPGGEMRVVVYRNGTLVPGEMITLFNNYQVLTSASMNVLDSPATTSAAEYEIYLRRNSGTGPVYLQQDCHITLMEIAQ